MSEKFNEVKYKNEFRKKTYYSAQVLFAKDDEPIIKTAAANAGQSVSEFIKTAVMERIDRNAN